MHKKIDIQELDIPKDDIECWERYTKLHWVYDLSRLLDAQNIKWSPYSVGELIHAEPNMILYSDKNYQIDSGQIYLKKPNGNHLFTELYIAKGEIKLIRHINPETGEELPTLSGEIQLRLSAFTSLHLHKFTGVFTAETWTNDIFRIRLCPHADINYETNQEVIKLVKRIYKKIDVNINGLTDQVLQETFAS